MSWFAVAGAVVSVAGSAISASSQRKAARRNQQNYSNALDALLAGAGPDVFGSRPEAVPYVPVNITKSQLATIAGNKKALPGAVDLSRLTNDAILANDLSRIRSIAPGYDQKLGAIFDEIGANLRGDTGLADYFPQLIRNRAEVASAIGTPGAGGSAATSRDLGLGQLQLQDRGTSMFQNWINVANQAISPVQAQMRPQDMFFTPQQRLEADIMQAQLKQQSEQSAAFIAAMPDPTAAGQFQARLASLGATTQTAQPSMLGPIMQGAGSIIGSLGSYYGSSRGGGGGGYYGVPQGGGYVPPAQYGQYPAQYGQQVRSLDSPPQGYGLWNSNANGYYNRTV